MNAEKMKELSANYETAVAYLTNLDAKGAHRRAVHIGAVTAYTTALLDEVEALRKLLADIRDDRSWRSNDNSLWPRICDAARHEPKDAER